MDYGLTCDVLTCKHFLFLTEEEFEAARKARGHLFEVLDIEEKLNIVLENYIEYEHELLQITLKDVLFSGGKWSDLTGARHQINRRLINLLSTVRLYPDQIRHDLGSLVGPLFVEQVLEPRISAEYNGRLGYRVIEALRNYGQHRGLPLHSITLSTKWVDTDEGQRRKQQVDLFLNSRALAKDPKFKKKVGAELTTQSEEVSLKPLVRAYMTGIIAIHQWVRKELKSQVIEWDLCLQSLIQRYRAEAEDEITGLSVVVREANGTYSNQVGIFEDFIHRRKWLERKNKGSGELEKVIVSSE